MEIQEINRSDISNFLNQLSRINWFEKSETPNEEYHVIYSIFEAYDGWSQQMFKTWEPQICLLEKEVQEVLGDAQIDEIFLNISRAIGDKLWDGYGIFIEKYNLKEECGLENEIMDFVKRDIAWACIEAILNKEGFFTRLLSIYKRGYFPCSWLGDYPGGIPVVI